MIITPTYFLKGELFIPNTTNGNAGKSTAIQNDLASIITKYERELLINALGVTLYNDLSSQTFLSGVIDTGAPDKWKDLVNGKTYARDSKEFIWDGLKGFDGNSLIAFYIYCKYLENDEVTYSTTGMANESVTNADRVSYTPKYVKAWSQFLTQYQSVNNGSPVRLVNGFGSVGLDYCGNGDCRVSLYQFLTDMNEADATAYPNFQFRIYESKNSFGI
jgi:hypothetical protein